jgi:hypothetical protein
VPNIVNSSAFASNGLGIQAVTVLLEQGRDVPVTIFLILMIIGLFFYFDWISAGADGGASLAMEVQVGLRRELSTVDAAGDPGQPGSILP